MNHADYEQKQKVYDELETRLTGLAEELVELLRPGLGEQSKKINVNLVIRLVLKYVGVELAEQIEKEQVDAERRP